MKNLIPFAIIVVASALDPSVLEEQLRNAAANGEEEEVKNILQNSEIDINAKDFHGHTALYQARGNHHGQVVRLLCPQAKGCVPILDSAMVGDEQAVETLINEGVDVNANDGILGNTALIWTAVFGYDKIANILLQKSEIDINAKDHLGRTALIWAAINGNEKLANILLQHSEIDVNAKYDEKFGIDEGRNALMMAIYKGHENVAKLLAENSATDVNAKSDSGMTALMWAARKGQTDVAKILLENPSVEVNAKDDFYDRTARDWARAEWDFLRPELIKLLEEATDDKKKCHQEYRSIICNEDHETNFANSSKTINWSVIYYVLLMLPHFF